MKSLNELTGDTEHTLRRIYRELRLGDFDPVAYDLHEHLNAIRDYNRKKHEISQRLETSTRSKTGAQQQLFSWGPLRIQSVFHALGISAFYQPFDHPVGKVQFHAFFEMTNDTISQLAKSAAVGMNQCRCLFPRRQPDHRVM